MGGGLLPAGRLGRALCVRGSGPAAGVGSGGVLGGSRGGVVEPARGEGVRVERAGFTGPGQRTRAGATGSARVGVTGAPPLADERLREAEGGELLADAVGPVEAVRVVHATVTERAAQRLDSGGLTPTSALGGVFQRAARRKLRGQEGRAIAVSWPKRRGNCGVPRNNETVAARASATF